MKLIVKTSVLVLVLVDLMPSSQQMAKYPTLMTGDAGM